jgi:hypothetical protein
MEESDTKKEINEFQQGVDYVLHVLRELGVPVDEILKKA